MDAPQSPQLAAWVAPVVVAATAIPTFVAFWIGGNPTLGVAWASVALGLAAVLAVGLRSDALRILAAVDDDERTRSLEHRAGAAMGQVLVAALVVLFLAEALQGESGLVYGLLLLLAEATRLTVVAALSRRS